MKDIKCQCGNHYCQMEINVNSDSDSVIWLEIEKCVITEDNMKYILAHNKIADSNYIIRIPFALDMNNALELINQLKQSIINKITTYHFDKE